MSKSVIKEKTIHTFPAYLIAKGVYLSVETIAKEFTSFFPPCPTNEYAIDNFCKAIGIDEIQYGTLPKNIRGSHFISPNGKIIIILDASCHAGRIHTLYHEIYEIICELANKPQLKTEYKANLFSASIIMPEEYFFEYMIRRSLMMSEIKIYYSEIATDSILLRINHLFKKRKIFHIAYFLKNTNAYIKASADEHKYMIDLKLCLSTLDRFDSINNDGFTKKIIGESCKKILDLPSDEFSLIKFSQKEFIVLAEPILLDWNGAIKEIAIQVMIEKDYDNLRNLLM